MSEQLIKKENKIPPTSAGKGRERSKEDTLRQ